MLLISHRFTVIRDSAEPCRLGAADQGDSTGHLGIVGVSKWHRWGIAYGHTYSRVRSAWSGQATRWIEEPRVLRRRK